MGFGLSGLWGQNWISREKFERSYEDHGGKFGTSKQYFNSARNFVNGNSTGKQSFIDSKGSTHMYNPATNQYALVTARGQIITYYFPTRGINYWYDLMDRHGIDY